MAESSNQGERMQALALVSADELKRELQRKAKCIVEDDDYTIHDTEEVMDCLSALKDLKLRPAPPPQYLCPISHQLMKDPVVLASGQTYDRPFIEKWLNKGNRTCPETKELLSNLDLIPNLLMKELISLWCKKHGLELPDKDQGIITEADRDRFNSLLHILSSNDDIPEKIKAAEQVRMLTKQFPSLRAFFEEDSIAVTKLLDPLMSENVNDHPKLQEHLITTVTNISIHDANKKLVATNPVVIPLLIESLTFGTIETRSNSAAALCTLSSLESNKCIIMKAGALEPLVKLLDEGPLLAMKDAAAAIYSLILVKENRAVAVFEGVVKVIMKKITDRILIDKMLVLLALLSSYDKAIEQMIKLEAVSCLLSIIKEDRSDESKEHCITILHTLCYNDRTRLKEMWRDESVNGAIANLALNGTTRAKRKAKEIVERIDKYFSDEQSS
ncbi:U-box domain-containing protein 9-like [Solanum lycopersicum]|uniref:U-box domain-containing protein 9-like n=1 Tax=Solanum lycopersicum TaxID=4081 RepID=UPI0002766DBE|nr:U-box domain-containing protein 9-like [Solanum lycopersicum]